jgi:crotonobetainyl-CoA:carnitine CoA-transferase CaiB-like acyl-CoA transferase
MMLADFGADVVRVDHPRGEVRSGDMLSRNKRSIALDLKTEGGQAALHRLAESADVFLEGNRPGVTRRLGCDWETISALNPRIVYCSLTGFGQDGPYADRGGVDQIVQGMSGLMSVTGEPGGGPMRVGVAISDTSAGMFLGQGILLALLHRERTGEGQWVHTSLLEAMMCKLDFQGARYTMNGEVPTQQGNDHPAYTPMGTFRASDGQVNIAASMPRLWERFCKALGAGDLLAHPDYQTTADRIARKDELKEAINAITGQRTAAELVSVLNEAGVPCGPINTIGEGFEDPQVRHLGMAKPAPHPQLGAVNLVRSPINLSRFPQDAEFRNAAPDPGTDTRAVLAELGLPASRIDALAAAGAIACTDPASA